MTSTPPSGRVDLHIRTHGRDYTEQYDSLDEAIEAALSLEDEPRERAEQITRAGEVLLTRAQLEQRFSAMRAGDP